MAEILPIRSKMLSNQLINLHMSEKFSRGTKIKEKNDMDI